MGIAARAAVAIVAVVVLAWLGVMERDARLQASGVAAAAPPPDFARADADLRAARLLNPDTAPDTARAVLYNSVGRKPQAAALLEDVLRREPDNLTAWALLLLVARDDDPAAVRRALAARRRLDPLSAGAR